MFAGCYQSSKLHRSEVAKNKELRIIIDSLIITVDYVQASLDTLHKGQITAQKDYERLYELYSNLKYYNERYQMEIENLTMQNKELRTKLLEQENIIAELKKKKKR